MSHIWYHADRHEQWKGWHGYSFVKNQDTATSTEDVSRPTTDLQRGQILIGIYRRKKQNKLRVFFVDEPFPGAPRHVQSFAKKLDELTA